MKACLGSPRPPDGAVIDPYSGAWIILAGNPVWGFEASVRQLLSALLLKGVEALGEFDGSFAIAWWNPGTGTLTLLRDRFGIEPLHYALTDGGVIFGSGAGDVARARGTPPTISQQGLVEFLTYCYLPGTSTLFEGTLRVPPGSLLEWRPGGPPPVVRRWYRLSFANPWNEPEAELATRYRELLEASVIRRIGAGRPGVFLSGGMDSSTVATFMRGRIAASLSSFSFRCGGSSFDESAYARELAPLAGVYPALRLGPPWWFHDSPEGMRRFREMATETAGFYNTVGFNDDTRAFPSIPARHDVARRVDCAFLARLVTEHRLGEDEAHEVAHDLAYGLVKRAYKL